MKVAVIAVGLMLALVVGPPAEAQTTGFLSVNALAQWPAATDFVQVGTGPSREETATLASSQAFSTSFAYDIGGGFVRGGPRWGLGAGLAMSRTQDSPAALVSLSLPHPILFNRPATATFTSTSGLQRRETATHLQAVVERRWTGGTVRLFAGPSHVRLAHVLVSQARISEALDFSPSLDYAIAITGVDSSRVTVSAWGAHAGADVGAFFSRHVGAGALVRYTRASATLPNRLQDVIDGGSGATSTEALGGLAVGGGLRLRF